MTQGDSQEEILARMRAYRRRKMLPKKIRNFLIYTAAITFGLIAILLYANQELLPLIADKIGLTFKTENTEVRVDAYNQAGH